MDVSRLVVSQVQRARPVPLPAYDGQETTGIQRRLDLELRNCKPGMIPPVKLMHRVIGDAFLVIGPGMDGVVVDAKGEIVPASSVFSEARPVSHYWSPSVPELPGVPALFVGFDGAWRNWYHWNVFALRRLALAASLLPAEVRFAVPEEALRMPAWRAGLDALGLADRIMPLAPGHYPVGQLHMLLTSTPDPTDIVYFDALHAAVPAPDLPQTRTVVIRRAQNARLEAGEQAALVAVASRMGLEQVDLAEHAFEEQRHMFGAARLIVASHGAALANLMHSRPGTRVLELNRRLDGEAITRPWFYQIAAMRGLTYMALDADAGEVTEDRIEAAITRLLRA